MRIRDVYKEMRETGWNRLETSLVFGTPVVFGLAPIALTASQVDWANHPYLSGGAMALSTLIGVCTSLVGFALGAGIATGLRVSRRMMELSPKREEKEQKTYEEMLTFEEEDGIGGLWDAFKRREVSAGDVSAFLTESISLEDHRRAIFYAEKLADYCEGEGFQGLASSFRTTLQNQQNIYARSLKEDGHCT